MKKKMEKKYVVIGLVILFFGSTIIVPGSSETIQQNFFSIDGWGYSEQIKIIPPTSKDNQQIKIELSQRTIDYSKTNSDGSDIRFYDEKGNALPFWIEEWNTKDASIIWVNIKEEGTSIIYMIYGNKNAMPQSTGNETFIFFDDFSSFNSEKWGAPSSFEPITSITKNGELKITEQYGGYGYLVSKEKIPGNTRTRFKFKQKNDGPNYPESQFVGLTNNQTPPLATEYIYAADSWR